MVAAGDATFSHDQLRRRANSAVVHDWTANAATQAALAAVFDAAVRCCSLTTPPFCS